LERGSSSGIPQKQSTKWGKAMDGKSQNQGRPEENEASSDLVESARRALASKLSAPKPEHPPSRAPGEGMHPAPNARAEPLGSIGAAGAKSAEEKGGKGKR
jgi:hypothetical protein